MEPLRRSWTFISFPWPCGPTVRPPITSARLSSDPGEGGDTTGASLLDPVGSARSHGCIRLANRAIDWLVGTIGPTQLAGIPVKVR
jgi:lipoprotein-anchoring transpeptidase ErfK/SrfK